MSLSGHAENVSLREHVRKESRVNVKIPFFPNALSVALSVRKEREREKKNKTSLRLHCAISTTHNHNYTELLLVQEMKFERHLHNCALPVTKTEWRDDIFWTCNRIMQAR